MACWRCKPLGAIESVRAIYVCNEDKVGWVPAAQAGSQSSSSPLERSTGASKSGTSSSQLSDLQVYVQVLSISMFVCTKHQDTGISLDKEKKGLCGEQSGI